MTNKINKRRKEEKDFFNILENAFKLLNNQTKGVIL